MKRLLISHLIAANLAAAWTVPIPGVSKVPVPETDSPASTPLRLSAPAASEPPAPSIGMASSATLPSSPAAAPSESRTLSSAPVVSVPIAASVSPVPSVNSSAAASSPLPSHPAASASGQMSNVDSPASSPAYPKITRAPFMSFTNPNSPGAAITSSAPNPKVTSGGTVYTTEHETRTVDPFVYSLIVSKIGSNTVVNSYIQLPPQTTGNGMQVSTEALSKLLPSSLTIIITPMQSASSMPISAAPSTPPPSTSLLTLSATSLTPKPSPDPSAPSTPTCPTSISLSPYGSLRISYAWPSSSTQTPDLSAPSTSITTLQTTVPGPTRTLTITKTRPLGEVVKATAPNLPGPILTKPNTPPGPLLIDTSAIAPSTVPFESPVAATAVRRDLRDRGDEADAPDTAEADFGVALGSDDEPSRQSRVRGESVGWGLWMGVHVLYNVLARVMG